MRGDETVEEIISDEEMEAMRAELRDIMARDGLTQQELADQAGIKYGTYNNWHNARYPGDNQQIARRIRNFLASRRERAKATSALPSAPGFQPTPTAQRVLSILTYAQARSVLTCVAGGPGIGKTTALRRYQATNPNVWIVTCTPSMGRLNNAIAKIAATLGCPERHSARMFDAILRKCDGTRGLLAIDDAQHLETRTIDELRALPDQVDVGIALVGNATVYSRLEGEGRRAEFAQLFSRISARMTQPRPHAKDVQMLLDAWGVTGSDERRLLSVIADKPGALRQMLQTLDMAMVLAAGETDAGDVPLVCQHIRDAWAQLNQVEGATL